MSHSQEIHPEPELELQLPDFCLIPLYVRKNKNLSESAKIYYGELNVFAMKYGYAWATDSQLAKMKEVDIATIERWNTQLEKEGFIRRETKNRPISASNGKFKWKKTRKIYMTVPKENKEENLENSNNVFDTFENEASNEPFENEGFHDSLKNEGLTSKLKEIKETTKPDEPSPVVFSSLSKLRIEPSLAAKVSAEHSEQDVDLAVERCLTWPTRPNDKVGLLTTLSKKDTWTDRDTPEKTLEKNVNFLKTLIKYDSFKTQFGTIYIGPSYFEVSTYNSTHTYLKAEEFDFMIRVKEFLRSIGNEYEMA